MARRFTVAVVLSVGCGQPVAPVVEAVEPAAAPAVGAAPVVEVPVVAAPEVVAVKPEVEPVAPEVVAVAPEVEPAGSGEFRLAALRDGTLGLFPMSNDVLLVVGAQSFAEARPGQELSRRTGMTWGLLDPEQQFVREWNTEAMGGRWPESAWISAYLAGPRHVSPYYVYYRKGERWQRKVNVDGFMQWYHAAFAPWTAGQTLALRVEAIDPQALAKYGSEEPPPAVVRRHTAALAAARARFVVIDPSPGAAAPPELPVGAAARTFTTRANGEIDAIVGDERGALTLLRWLPGATEAQRFALPEIGGGFPGTMQPVTLVARGDDELWVGAEVQGAAYLARFDGTQWTPRRLPKDQPVRSLSVGSDGVLWAVSGPERDEFAAAEAAGGLWRSSDGERWQAVALPTVQFPDLAVKRWEYFEYDSDYRELYGDPADAEQRHSVVPLQVWSRGAGDVWVVGLTAAAQRMSADQSHTFSREVVLRTGPVKTPLRLPSDNELRLEMLEERPVKDHDFDKEEGVCMRGRLVTFLSLPADAPSEGPLPQVEALLAAHPELRAQITELWEARVRGRRMVAIMADGSTKAQADALLAALNEVVPEKRSFACRVPILVRPLYDAAAMQAAAKAHSAANPEAGD